MLISALCRHLGLKIYKTSLIFLYICDVLALVVFILFLISGFINYAKIISILALTPFVVVVQIFVNRFSVLNLPLSNPSPQQPYHKE